MSYNGSGVFVRLYNWVNDKANGIKIRADRMDAEMNGFATGLSTCITKDGQTTPTQNLPMGGKRHTGCGDAVASSDYATLGQVTTAIATTQSSVAITGGTITGITDLAIADGGTGASTAENARTNLGLGTMATQSAGSVNITGGTVGGLSSLNTSGSVIIGDSASSMGGEGTNAAYKQTIIGSSAPLCAERLAASSTGVMIEAKLKRGATAPAESDDSGWQISSSWNDSTGVLREGAKIRHAVSGTPGSGFVPTRTDVYNTDASGNFHINTRFEKDGTVQHCYKGSTTRSEVSYTRAWCALTGSTGAILASGNISSVTRTGVGLYTVAFTSAMPDSNYAVTSSLLDTGSTGALSLTVRTKSTTGFTCYVGTGSSTAVDAGQVMFTVTR